MNSISLNLFLTAILPIEFSVLTKIFKYENIYNAVNFHCNNANSEIAIHKMFAANQIKTSSIHTQYNTSFAIPHYYPRIGMILNTSCNNWFTVLDNLRATAIFKSPFKWFVIAEDFNSTIGVLSQYPIEIDSDITIIKKINNNTFNLHEMYNTGFYTSGQLKVEKIGRWDSSLRLEKRRRTDLSGVKLKCTVVITQKVMNETFEAYTERSKLSKSDTLHKLKYYTLLKYLRDMYNMR